MEKFTSRTFVVLIYGVLLLMITKRTSSVVYPSIMWHAENPLFKGPHCNGEGYANMYLDSTSRITFVCPKQDFTTFMKKQTYDDPGMSNENLFLVTKAEFDSCNITKYNKAARFLVQEPTRLSLVCHKLPDFEIQYKEFQLSALASSTTGYEFKVGKTYYFISTSDGRKREAGEEQNLRGGRCKDNNMRLAIHICSSKSKCRDCENQCCPDINGPPKTTTESATTLMTTSTTATPIVSQNSETHTRGQNKTTNSTTTSNEIPNINGVANDNGPFFSSEEENNMVLPPEPAVSQNVGKPMPRKSDSTSSLTTTALVLFFAGIVIGAGAVLLISMIVRRHKRRSQKEKRNEKIQVHDSVAFGDQTIENDETATLRRQPSQYRTGTDCKRLLSTASNGSGGSSENGSEVSENCIACV